jgi:metal-dependent hydrolase (beta-lactamase superfamily II)
MLNSLKQTNKQINKSSTPIFEQSISANAVVISHGHVDHFGGESNNNSGVLQLAFLNPNAAGCMYDCIIDHYSTHAHKHRYFFPRQST